MATDRVRAHERATAADPWDGRPSKEAVFREKVQAAAPGSEIADLDPLLDKMRLVKSVNEISDRSSLDYIGKRELIPAAARPIWR